MNGLLLYFSFICTIGLSCCTRTPDEKLFVVEDGGLFYPFAYTELYSYTPTGQLERAEYSDGREQWRKSDSLGNLYPDPDCTVRRFLKGGAMEQDGKWHCEYDKDGNLKERYIGTGKWLDGKQRRWKYKWNADGSLAKVVRPDGQEVTFEYDALGRRLSKSFGINVTRWMWNGNVPLHQWIQYRSYSAGYSNMIIKFYL